MMNSSRSLPALATLRDESLLHLLVRALDTRFVGTLVLTDRLGRRHVIYFDDGVPCQAHTPCHIASLSAIVRELGFVDGEALLESEESAGHNTILLARQLISGGLLTELQVRAALATQLMRRLRAFMRLPLQTRCTMHPNRNLVPGGEYGLLAPCNPLPLITEGVRIMAATLPIDQALRQLGTAHLSLHPRAPLRALGLGRERVVVNALAKRARTLGELREAGVATEEVLRTTLYLLLVTRSLMVTRNSGVAPASEGPPVSAPAHSNVESGVRPRCAAAGAQGSWSIGPDAKRVTRR